MPNRSMTDRVDALEHYNAAYTATQTPSTGVDLKGYTKAEVCVYIGTVTNIQDSAGPGWTLTLEHSDSASSGFAAVGDTDVVIPDNEQAIASGVFATIDDDEDDDKVWRIGYIGNKRYVRVVATAVSTPGSTPIAAFVLAEKAVAL